MRTASPMSSQGRVQILKKTGSVALGLAILAFGAYGIWWALDAIWSGVSGHVDKTVIAALVTGSLLATAAIVAKHLEHRHSVEAGFRDQKIAHYEQFFILFGEFSKGEMSQEELLPKLEEWKRVAQLWGGPKIVKSFLKLSSLDTAPAKTIGDLATRVEVMGAMCLAMRRDLGLSNRGILPSARKGSINKATAFGVYCQLKHPALFLDNLAKNPQMPAEDYQVIEAAATLRATLQDQADGV